jgi:ribosomal-protein-alanine N-acetyltransferase
MTEYSPRICSIESSHIADLIRIGEQTNLSPWSAQSYLDELKNPNAVMLRLVSEDNETIGFVVGRVIAGGHIEIRTDAEIYNIAVVAEHQGSGHGQALLSAFVERSIARGAKHVWLEVRESNKKAIAFYARNGFEQVQTRPNFYDDPSEAALLMGLNLSTQKEL